mmetsp:Transcript_79784/g.220649  ORF Transcript_79784/g.220649 Transcript_79784/m.220649 type:complete len:408 (-) Transcript_79784:685-1908(-)
MDELQAVGHLLRDLGYVLVDAVAREHAPEGGVQDLLQRFALGLVTRRHAVQLLTTLHSRLLPITRSLKVSVFCAPLLREELTLACHRDLPALPVITEDELLLSQLPTLPHVANVAHHETPAQLVHHEVADAHRPPTQVILGQASAHEDVTAVGVFAGLSPHIVQHELVERIHRRAAFTHGAEPDSLVAEDLCLLGFLVQLFRAFPHVEVHDYMWLHDAVTPLSRTKHHLLLPAFIVASDLDSALGTNQQLPALIMKETGELRCCIQDVMGFPTVLLVAEGLKLRWEHHLLTGPGLRALEPRLEPPVDAVHVRAIDFDEACLTQLHQKVRTFTKGMVVEAEDQLLLAVLAALTVVAAVHGDQAPGFVFANKVAELSGQEAEVVLALVAALFEDTLSTCVEPIAEGLVA